MRSFLSKTLDAALARSSVSALQELEVRSARMLGKGYGAVTASLEVETCLSLLGSDISGPVVALDIGANVGDWSAEMLRRRPDARIFAFEPSSVTYETLSRRFHDSSQVTAIQKAASSEGGTSPLYGDFKGSSWSSLSRRRIPGLAHDFDFCETVEIVTLDAWVEAHGVVPKVMKLDIEGHEYAALLGARETLKLCTVVQFEFGGCSLDSRTYFRDLFELLTRSGFQLFRLTPRGLLRIPQYRETDETFAFTTYFATAHVR